MEYNKYIKNIGNGSFYIESLSDTNEKYKQCAYFIKEAKNICVLTGAGISTNVGIPDFRSKNGWYSKDSEDILSFNNFIKNPKEVYSFLYRYYKLIDVEPSISHKLISSLENMDKNVTIITQNIDKLHQKSGSTDIIEYHGGLDRANCVMCNKEYDIKSVLNENINKDNFNYKCECGGYIKPNITLFEEDILEDSFAQKEISKADLVIIIGTSLQVSPFCTLPFYAHIDTPFIIINKNPTYLDDNRMSIPIHGDCDLIMTNIFKALDKN